MEEVSTNGLVDKCEDLEGYECMDYTQCNPDKLVETCSNQPLIDLRTNFVSIPEYEDELGVTVVDIAKSPCKQPNQVCCQPGKATIKPPANEIKCGIHNPNGLNNVKYVSSDPTKPVFSQFGEWPHACMVLKTDTEEFLGGASLIALKIVITAAHIVRCVL